MGMINEGDIVVFKGGLFVAQQDERVVNGNDLVTIKNIITGKEIVVHKKYCKFFWLQTGMLIKLAKSKNIYMVTDIRVYVHDVGKPIVVDLLSVHTGGSIFYTLAYITETFSEYFIPE